MVIFASYVTVKSRENKLYKVLQTFNPSLVILYKNILIFAWIYYSCSQQYLVLWKYFGYSSVYKHYIFFSRSIKISHKAIKHQQGFGYKASQRFKLPPSHNSSILCESVTCHLTRQRTHYGGLLLLQTYTYVYAWTQTTCVRAHTQTWSHTLTHTEKGYNSSYGC